MSAADIIKELPKLSKVERRAVLEKLRDLAQQDEDAGVCNAAAGEQAAASDRMEEPAVPYHPVDLRARGINAAQASDLRARLQTFAQDWERPEASVYDQDPAR